MQVWRSNFSSFAEKITCTDIPEPPSFVIWRHDGSIISYDSPRGGVSVFTVKGEVTVSFLLIQHAKPSDSGTYSCSPSLGDSISVNVHILRGEYIARWGTNKASPSKILGSVLLLSSLLLNVCIIMAGVGLSVCLSVCL